MEETNETRVSPEEQAAKGMEAKKTLRTRMSEFMRSQNEKNGVSRDVMLYYQKVLEGTTEGSFRRAALEKLKPIMEVAAFEAGRIVKMAKWGLKVAGLVCAAIGVGAPVAVAVELGGFLIEPVSRLMIKKETFKREIANRANKKLGIAKRVDGVIDGIFRWKEKPPAPKPMPARA